MDKSALLSLVKSRPYGNFSSKIVPGFNTCIRRISGQERDSHELAIIDESGKPDVRKFKGMRSRLVAMGLCDENGKTLFSEKEADSLDDDLLKEAYEAIRAFNNMNKEAAEDSAED